MRTLILVSTIVLSVCIAGCSAPAPSPAPTPTSTPTSTLTATPTETPTPTFTPSPTPDPWGDVTITPDQHVLIGVVGDFSGENAALYEAVAQAAELAVTDHGPLLEIPVELVQMDDQCDPNGVDMTKAMSLLGQGIGVVGFSCPDAAATELSAFQFVHLTAIASSMTHVGISTRAPEIFNRVVLDSMTQIHTDRFFDLRGQESYQTFIADFESRTGTPAGDDGLFLAGTYDAVMILLKAAEESAAVRDDGTLVIGRQALANAVRATRVYPGVSGPITFDERGERLPPVEPDRFRDIVVAEGSPIRVAVPLPAEYAILAEVVEMAIRDYGPIKGFAIEPVLFADMCANGSGASATDAILADSTITGVIGPVCTDATLAAAEPLTFGQITLLATGATGDALTDIHLSGFNRVVMPQRQIDVRDLPGPDYINELDAVQAFYTRFLEETGHTRADFAGFDYLLAYTYDATGLMLSSLDEAAIPAPDGSLVVGLRRVTVNVRGAYYPGITGNVAFDQYGNRLYAP